MTTDDVRADAREWLDNAPTLAEGRRHTVTLLAEVDKLQRWKDEALPVIFGLQDLGRALDIPLGHSITGPEAAEKARTLRAERDAALTVIAKVREQATDVDLYGGHSGPSLARHILNIIGGEA